MSDSQQFCARSAFMNGRVLIVALLALIIHDPAQARQQRFSDALTYYTNTNGTTEGVQALAAAATQQNHLIVIGKQSASAACDPAGDETLANAVRRLAPAQRRNVHPFLCAYGTDKQILEHVERMLDNYDDIWEGIAGVGGGATPQSDLTVTEQILRLAEDRSLTVIPALQQRMLSRVMTQHPQLRFMIDFEQASELAAATPVDILLQQHRNMWIMLLRSQVKHLLLNDAITPFWETLLTQHSNRWLLASKRAGEFKTAPAAALAAFNTVLSSIPSAAADRIAQQNLFDALGKPRPRAPVALVVE